MAVYRFRKEELEAHLNRGALWAVTYGDLMSYLMILFLIMLSYTLSKETKPQDQPKIDQSLLQIQSVFGGKIDPKIKEAADQKDREVFAYQELKKNMEGKDVGIIITEKSVRMNLKDGILFDSGKAELKEEALPVLKTIATEMVSLKNEIRVEGHTDTVPIRGKRFGSNWELSMARAYAVVRRMQEFGVAPGRLSGIGYGEHRPIGDNATAEGRAKNRRIEITLLRSE
ncbi:MAG: OmpA family protein [Elusimicrobiota bacterium]